MEISFKNKKAIVTGGAQGIGREIVNQLVQCGASVVVFDFNKDNLKKLKSELPDVETVEVDLTNWDETEKVMKNALPADLLVNNAGISYLHSVNEITEKQYLGMFAINIGAVIHLTSLFTASLLSRKAEGAIVSISSQASQAGLDLHSLYCATKGAVDGFTRATALELGRNGVRINAVCPTVVKTELGDRLWQKEDKRKMLERIPLGRFAETSDIANTVLYLLSDKAKMITGACIPVDGGFLAT